MQEPYFGTLTGGPGVQAYLAALLNGAAWLNVAMMLLLLLVLGLCGWLYYQALRPEPGAGRLPHGTIVLPTRAAKVEDAALQAQIRQIQTRYVRGEIDLIEYEDALDALRQGRAA